MDENKICDDCDKEKITVQYDLDGRMLCHDCYEERRVNGEYEYDDE